MTGSILDGLLFLIDTLFNIYLIILIIRLILAWSGIHYLHPSVQVIVKLTSFVVKPLKKFLPDIRGIELATIFLILVIASIKWTLRIWLPFAFPNLFGVLILAFADIIHLGLQVFFYAILLQALLSWIQPGFPLNQALYQFTSPIMQPIRRLVPPISGFDISPIPALILLQLIIIVFIQPLMGIGWAIAHR